MIRMSVADISTTNHTSAMKDKMLRTCAEGNRRQKQVLTEAAMEAARRLLQLAPREERGCCAVLTLRLGKHERCRRC
jgi:hypothetical protein